MQACSAGCAGGGVREEGRGTQRTAAPGCAACRARGGAGWGASVSLAEGLGNQKGSGRQAWAGGMGDARWCAARRGCSVARRWSRRVGRTPARLQARLGAVARACDTVGGQPVTPRRRAPRRAPGQRCTSCCTPGRGPGSRPPAHQPGGGGGRRAETLLSAGERGQWGWGAGERGCGSSRNVGRRRSRPRPGRCR